MGSLEAACISGFLCRLCSEMHRTVIHIYGDQGQKHGLAKKINAYLPITITPSDPLPKTICETCMARVEQHHELMLKMEKHRSLFASQSARAEVIRSVRNVLPLLRYPNTAHTGDTDDSDEAPPARRNNPASANGSTENSVSDEIDSDAETECDSVCSSKESKDNSNSSNSSGSNNSLT